MEHAKQPCTFEGALARIAGLEFAESIGGVARLDLVKDVVSVEFEVI
jgi:hypothetical protein